MGPTRRYFMKYLGVGSYALLCNGRVRADVGRPRRISTTLPFESIAPSKLDSVVLPKGFEYDTIASWGDPLGSHGPHGPEHFGYDNDFTCYVPLDAAKQAANVEDGLLWVNHEDTHEVFVSEYEPGKLKTREQIRTEKLSVGGSILHVRREQGKWRRLASSPYHKRFTALYPEIKPTGPASTAIGTPIGTLANCSGGRTPWFTVLSCEENFDLFVDPTTPGSRGRHRWEDVADEKIDPHHYGWVVEVDPIGELPPHKLTALGRFAHENTCWRLDPVSNKLVIYMGDDGQDQYFYKYVSAAPYRANVPRGERRKLLEHGTLYVADFIQRRWIPLDLERTPELKQGFSSQAEVLIHTRKAGTLVKATQLDRPEDCEVHPRDGSVYIAMTNNDRRLNFFGRIVRLLEKADRADGEAFTFEIFLTGGPDSGLAAPDNLAFDRQANLWVACDLHETKLNKPGFDVFGNNGLFVVPTLGKERGCAFQFAAAPVEAEFTGPWFTEKGDTLFLSVQHPGSLTEKIAEPTSTWPRLKNDGIPRPSVIAIRGTFG